jgi:hypothetical protein
MKAGLTFFEDDGLDKPCLRAKPTINKQKTNMEKILLPVSVASLMMLATGCVAPNGPMGGTYGNIYTDVSGAVSATGNAKGTKTGTATSKGILGFASGDSSIKAACDNGGITKIEHVDYHVESVLGVYTRTTVTVYGE